MSPRRRPVAVGEVLGELLPPEASGRLLAIARGWPAAVGPAIARETSCARLAADGVLLVHCSSSIWAAELELLGPRLLESLRGALGAAAPAGVRFRVGTLPTRADARPVARLPTPPTRPARQAAAALAAPIRDEGLRASAERAIAGALSAPVRGD